MTQNNDTDDETLYVKVETLEQFNQRGFERMAEIDDGRREPFDETHVRSFTNFEDLSRTFSVKNMELVQAIAAHEPESIRETARIVDRGTKEVHQNLTELDALGIIEFEENGKAKQPIVIYDEIQANIPIPLPNVTGDETTDDEAETAPA